jgi:lysophospholipase L1-like esterase
MRQFLREWGSVLGAVLVAGTLAAAAPAAEAESSTFAATSAASPWQDAFDAFAAADRANPPRAGGVVFVGSSSIRLWNGLETQFATLPNVLNRGFGGSQMSDCTKHLQRLVLAYKPSLVVVYAGENDLAAGATPESVLASFKAFADGVRGALPQTRIAYLSIKPSPLRESLMPKIRVTNGLIRDYVASLENARFIDVHAQMLDAQGKARRELFSKDLLHLNAEGYALWRREIAARLP